MALKSTVFKAQLQITDLDRDYYEGFNLTLARHPSETDERMMIRLLAFALHAHERLSFTKGLCADDEPELWQKSLSDEIEVWIEVGLPDERRLKKACNRAREVYLYTYGGRAAKIWWEQNAGKLSRYSNLKVLDLAESETQTLAAMAQRTMDIQCTIQDQHAWLCDAEHSVTVEPTLLKAMSE